MRDNSFIAYRALPHLNNKHTIFGRLIDDPTPSSTTLNAMELDPVDPATNRPKTDIRIKDVTVFVDPFEEFMKQRKEAEEAEAQQKAKKPDDGKDGVDDDQITWTGKRVRGLFDENNKKASDTGGVGKYLKAALADQQAAAGRGGEEDEIVGFVDDDHPEAEAEHVRKKLKAAAGRRPGEFGNFDNW